MLKIKQSKLLNEKGYVMHHWYFMKFSETFDVTTTGQMYICGDVYFNGKFKIYRQIPLKRVKNIEMIIPIDNKNKNNKNNKNHQNHQNNKNNNNNQEYIWHIKTRKGAREIELLTAARESAATNKIDKIEVINKMSKMFEMDSFLVSQNNMDNYFKKHLKERQDSILNKLVEYFKPKLGQ